MVEHKENTKQRLLEGACQVFAEKGYHHATIADICKAAGANIALVNYYFGDKAKLYDTVWRYAFDCTRRRFPLDKGVSSDDKPEVRLRACFHAMLSRIFSTGASDFFGRLLVQEMANPTLTLEHIVNEALRPQTDYFMVVLRELLGSKADQTTLIQCMISTMGQCFILNANRPLRKRLFGENDFSKIDVDPLADHMTLFSLAGLQAIKAKLEMQ